MASTGPLTGFELILTMTASAFRNIGKGCKALEDGCYEAARSWLEFGVRYCEELGATGSDPVEDDVMRAIGTRLDPRLVPAMQAIGQGCREVLGQDHPEGRSAIAR